MGETVLIASGKGGVGKSTVCAAVARALASQGRRVLVVDGDAGLRSLDLLLSLADQVVYDWLDVLHGAVSTNSVLLRCEDEGELYFLPAPATENDADPALFCKLIQLLAEKFDFVLLDAPAGVGEMVRLLSAPATNAVIVATPDAASVRSAYLTGARLISRGIAAPRLLLNKVQPARIRRGEQANLDELIDRTELRLIGVVPLCAEIADSAAQGRLTFPQDCAAAEAFRRLARRMQGESVPLAPM